MERIMRMITNKNGFTLVELLVTMSIVSVIMLVVLFSYSSFSDSLALSSAGQEVAIAIRQAQTYALNVREVSANTGQFNSFGIYFDQTNSTTNKNYYVFTDVPVAPPLPVGNKKYDVGSGCGSGSTECVERFTLRNGVIISSITTTGGCAAARTIHITFLRPNPDADINFMNGGGSPVCSPALNGQIILTSPKGKTLTITVDKTGQIALQ